MYKHYCKDSQCPGHTKNWERCCDMRAFNSVDNPTPNRKNKQTKKAPKATLPRIVFA
ncbi:conserved protein of unknown function [Pseudodesulfovibrio profundus]|uniref:Uncharacterized protein n=1 Tax=Pseudodesulfovibrio profundus TaxID=57320 RepID=A0A2C8F371_9BACT|nr:conserved protein of unknown function [Pseudodesulfovibrio profundus]